MKEGEKDSKKLIKSISAEKLVYIDESGIEERIVKDRGWGKKSHKRKVVNIMKGQIL